MRSQPTGMTVGTCRSAVTVAEVEGTSSVGDLEVGVGLGVTGWEAPCVSVKVTDRFWSLWAVGTQHSEHSARGKLTGTSS